LKRKTTQASTTITHYTTYSYLKKKEKKNGGRGGIAATSELKTIQDTSHQLVKCEPPFIKICTHE